MDGDKIISALVCIHVRGLAMAQWVGAPRVVMPEPNTASSTKIVGS